MREDATRALPRGWGTADGHGRSEPWRIRFADEDVRDVARRQARSDVEQVRFVARRQTDRVGAGVEVAGGGLTGGVNELRELRAQRQVFTEDAVVPKRLRALASSACLHPNAGCYTVNLAA